MLLHQMGPQLKLPIRGNNSIHALSVLQTCFIVSCFMGLVPAFNCLSTHVIIKLLFQLFFRFDHKICPRSAGHKPGLCIEKSKNPRYSPTRRGSGYKWLVHNQCFVNNTTDFPVNLGLFHNFKSVKYLYFVNHLSERAYGSMYSGLENGK